MEEEKKANPDWLERDRYRYAFEHAGISVTDQQLDDFISGLSQHHWVYTEDYPTPKRPKRKQKPKGDLPPY